MHECRGHGQSANRGEECEWDSEWPQPARLRTEVIAQHRLPKEVNARESIGAADLAQGAEEQQRVTYCLKSDRDDPKVFFTNVFSYSNRRRVCEHAYQTTRKDLLDRKDELIPILKRHGINLRTDVLEDKSRHYWVADTGRVAEAV